MYFDGTGNLITTGSGSASVTFNFGWNDNPSDHGQALGNYSISALGISFDQGNTTTGSDTATVTVTGGTTYNAVVTGAPGVGGYHVENSSSGGVNQKFCVWDSDGTDCNAWVEVASITQQGATMQFGPISTNQSYVDTSPASIPAGSTWNCTSIICHIGNTRGELFGKVINGKFLVEDITGANSDNDYVDLTVHCNVADFTGASTNANTAATGNFAIALPAGAFATTDINTLWEPGDGAP